VASAHQGPLGQPSNSGDATRFRAGDSAGEESVGRAGVLAAWSMGRVSSTGGKGVQVGDNSAGKFSELWATDCDGGLRRMSCICCLKSGGNLVRTSGWKPYKNGSLHSPRDVKPKAMRGSHKYQKTVV